MSFKLRIVVYATIMAISISVVNLTIEHFLFPLPSIDTRNYDLGNFTLHYTSTDIDNEGVGIIRDTDRLQFEITVVNKYSGDAFLRYSDSISNSGPPANIPIEPEKLIPKGDKVEFTRVFPIRAGVNEMDAIFDFYPAPNSTPGLPRISGEEIQQVPIQLSKVRALTQSEYEGRFALVTTIILAVATVGLVLVTLLNVRETRNTVLVLKESREAEFLPHIVPTLSMLGPVALTLEIVNIGKGGAKELEVKYRIKEIPNSEKTWYQNLFKAGDSQIFYLKDENQNLAINQEYFESHQTTIEVNASYKDIFDKLHQTTNSIDITQYVKQFKTVSVQYKEKDMDKITSSLDKAANSLGDIKTNMKNIQDQIADNSYADSMDFQLSIARRKIHEQIKNKNSIKKIDSLLDDLSIFIKDDNSILYVNNIMEILGKLKKINPKIIQIMKDTMIKLGYLIKFENI